MSGEEARHAARSLRMREGEEIAVGDGEGRIYTVALEAVRKEGVRGAIRNVRLVERERPGVILSQAVCRAARMDEVIARAAESGIREVRPYLSPRSELSSLEKAASRLPRWRRIAREASKVARRAWPLTVTDVVDWGSCEDTFRGLSLSILLWEDERASGLRGVLPLVAPRLLGLIVGPEGGFSSDEARILEDLGAVTARMGDLILRTESAGPHAAMVIRYHYGLLEPAGGDALG